MIVACDYDNVICNLQETVINLFNKRYKTNYALTDFHDHDVANTLPIKEATAMKKMYGESGLYKQVTPIAGAQEGLKKLISAGHQVYIVSDIIPKTYAEKHEWLKHFFPFIDDTHIVAMKHKHLFKCDVMIEDNIQTLLDGAHYDRICMDYPWNRTVHEDYIYDIHRCRNWQQIVDVINKINEKESDVE